MLLEKCIFVMVERLRIQGRKLGENIWRRISGLGVCVKFVVLTMI